MELFKKLGVEFETGNRDNLDLWINLEENFDISKALKKINKTTIEIVEFEELKKAVNNFVSKLEKELEEDCKKEETLSNLLKKRKLEKKINFIKEINYDNKIKLMQLEEIVVGESLEKIQKVELLEEKLVIKKNKRKDRVIYGFKRDETIEIKEETISLEEYVERIYDEDFLKKLENLLISLKKLENLILIKEIEPINEDEIFDLNKKIEKTEEIIKKRNVYFPRWTEIKNNLLVIINLEESIKTSREFIKAQIITKDYGYTSIFNTNTESYNLIKSIIQYLRDKVLEEDTTTRIFEDKKIEKIIKKVV